MTTWSLTGREATCGGGGGRRAPGACVQPVHKVSQVFQGGFFLEVYLNSVDAVLQQHTVRIVVSDATVVVDAAEPCRVQKIGERYQPRDAELSTLAEDVGICDVRRWQPSCKAGLRGCDLFFGVQQLLLAVVHAGEGRVPSTAVTTREHHGPMTNTQFCWFVHARTFVL